ncbi:hypothetical protein RYX36_015199 [Vicia faba]
MNWNICLMMMRIWLKCILLKRYFNSSWNKRLLRKILTEDIDAHDDDDNDIDRAQGVEISLEEGVGGGAGYEDEDHQNQNVGEHMFGATNQIGRDSRGGTRASTTYSAITNKLDVEELEMLLEAYFVQIDGTLNKLSTLREYVDDTGLHQHYAG